MNNQSLQFTKKKVIGIVLVLLLLICVGFFLTNSIVIIKSSHNKTVDIKISRMNSNEVVNNFELNSGSKFMIIPKGDYVVDAREKDKQNTYMKKFRGFSYTTINVSLSAQKQSSLLGVSTLGCAIDHPKNNQSIFYRCNQNANSQNLLEITQDNQPTRTITMSSMYDPVNDDSPKNIDQGESLGSSIKPYLGGFLYAVAGGGNLTFYKLDSVGSKISDPVIVNNFRGTLDDSTFTTSQDTSDTSFSILDRDKKRILIFNNLNKSVSKEVDVSELLNHNDESTISSLYHSSKNIYLSVLRNPTMLEYHDDEGQSVEEIQEAVQDAAEQQSINAVKIAESSEIESVKIPDNLTIREASVNGSGDLVLIPQRDSTSKEIVVVNGKKLKKLNFVANEIQEVCWIDNSKLAYSTQSDDDTSSIFSFDTSKGVSHLLYENYSSAITGLFCNNSSLTFSVRASDDGLLEGATYYSLVDQDKSSTQLSTILPLYVDLPEYETLLKIEQHRTGVKTSLVVEPANKPSDDYIQNKVLDELSLRGIDTKNVKITIN